jgi:hypothetical protein
MATQGPNSPGTMADDSSIGSVAWSNPNNAKISDNTYTTADDDLDSTSHYLKATNFGFSVPVNATIDGIVVEVEKNSNSDAFHTILDIKARIVKSDGTIGTTDRSNVGIEWPTTDTYITYGSSSDLWGETWTYSDINNSNFGFALQITGDASSGTAQARVDHIRITVYYTEAAKTITGVFSMTGVQSITL